MFLLLLASLLLLAPILLITSLLLLSFPRLGSGIPVVFWRPPPSAVLVVSYAAVKPAVIVSSLESLHAMAILFSLC